MHIYIYTALAHGNNRSMEGNAFQGLSCTLIICIKAIPVFGSRFQKSRKGFGAGTSVHPVNATLKYTFVSQGLIQQNKPLGNLNNPSLQLNY